jgi:cytochrome c-type biogenesis protein CcmH
MIGRRRRLGFGRLSLLIGLMGLACDRNIAPFVPGEEPRQPDLSRIFPVPEDDVSPAGALRADPSRRATSEANPRDAARSGASIRGRIRLAESAASASGTLFVIARPQGNDAGPPLAVLRIPDPSFPLDFEIGPDQLMIPGMSFEGPIDLTARLDRDGDAMTRNQNDPQTRTAEFANPGDVGLELLLD